jgi:hypothetical protein
VTLVVAVSGPRSPRYEARRVTNRDILPRVFGGILRRILREPSRARRELLKEIWIDLKRFGASEVRNIPLARIRGIDTISVEGAVAQPDRLVLCALAKLLECERIFEFGTFRGETSWLLAHNLPTATVHTLDLGSADVAARARLELTDPEYFVDWDRGTRFRGTPEAMRITQLVGDSAAFDMTPYRRNIDLVYVDASHSYSYVRSDTEAALAMLTRFGTIVWDDYTYYSGIYAYLNELAPTLDAPIYHIVGTRLAVYSRWPIVVDG